MPGHLGPKNAESTKTQIDEEGHGHLDPKVSSAGVEQSSLRA